MKSMLSIVSNSGSPSAKHRSELPAQVNTCAQISDSLPRWVCSTRARGRLRTHYVTFLLRFSFSKVLGVPHGIACVRQAARERDSCTWSLQEETGKKCKLSELRCSLDKLCFCVPEELSCKGRGVQKALQVLPV